MHAKHIKPIDPRDQRTRSASEPESAPRRTLGIRGPSRRTLGLRGPSRRTLGFKGPSRRTLGFRGPSRRTLGRMSG